MVKGKTGKRYSEEEKAKILAYIKANPGRGVISRVKAKYGISYSALKRWLPETPKKREQAARKNLGKVAPRKVKGLKGILGLIRKTEANLEALKARIAAL